MKCEKLQALLSEMAIDRARVPADVRQHAEECARCQTELKELQATMRMLDAWEVPEPSPYFDSRLAARLREARNSAKPGWLERMRAHMLFESNLRMRPVLACALAVFVVAGAGSYEGFVTLHKPAPQQREVSATITDLELLDSNAQTLQQLAAFEDTDASAAQSASSNMSN
jgi:hypothetical protein